MSEPSNLKKPKWDTSIPDFLAFRKYMAQMNTFAIQVTGPQTADRQGLLWALYSPAQFQQMTGNAPAPIVDPGPYPPNLVGGALENHKEEKVGFKVQETNLPFLANVFEGGLASRIRRTIEVNYSLDHLTLQEQVEALEQALPMKQADLDYLTLQISAPFAAGTQIEEHINMQLENLAHLRRAGQPVPSLQAIKYMWRSFSSTPADVEDYAHARAQYLVQHGAIVDQTPDTLGPFLIAYVASQLEHHQTTNQALRAARAHAHAAVVAPAIASVNHPLAPPPPVAAPAVAQQHPNQRARGGRGGAGVPAGPPPVPLQGAPGFYCWTHGTCYHYSLTCKRPAAAHRWDATLVNRLGGAP